MEFCKIGATARHSGYTIIENAFFNDYLLNAPAECTKAYIYGLFVAQSNGEDNTIEHMSRMLGIGVQDLIEIFTYWQDKGLVQLVQLEPMQVIFLPVKNAIGNLKKFNIGKYNDFNILIQSLFSTRNITANEFMEYYTVIESFHMQPEALLEIARYAVSIKDNSVGHRYITTIAKLWANENILTLADVKSKISDLGVYDDQLRVVLKCLGSKAKPLIEDKALLDKWLIKMGYDMDTVCGVANALRSKKLKSTFETLDARLSKYYELHLQTMTEIVAFEDTKTMLNSLARTITKKLGLYYEDVTSVVENYILPFEQMGYDELLLSTIADYCFRQSIRTLVGYADIVHKLYKLGIVSISSFEQYLSDIFASDDSIKVILTTLGLTRRVNEQDRNFYRIWTQSWGFDDDITTFAAQVSANKPNALNYMNKILSSWYSANISTLDAARSFAAQFASAPTKVVDNFVGKSYTPEQLNSLFCNLDEVEV